MRLGVIIPTRGDRPRFLKWSKYMLYSQTLRPDYVKIIDFEPVKGEKDLTKRYRIGYEALKDKCDLIFFWEDDDYYDKDYIKRMSQLYSSQGDAELFGFDNTIYYHVKWQQWRLLKHPNHSSMFSTVIKGGLKIPWPNDNFVFLDTFLWKALNGKLTSLHNMNVGIKHGVGVVGGAGHHRKKLYTNTDSNFKYLSTLVDPVSLKFYKSL